jgi:hypothetical protein
MREGPTRGKYSPVPHALVLDVEDTDTPALTWPDANQLR